jgi:hypothetical protein
VQRFNGYLFVPSHAYCDERAPQKFRETELHQNFPIAPHKISFSACAKIVNIIKWLGAFLYRPPCQAPAQRKKENFKFGIADNPLKTLT